MSGNEPLLLTDEQMRTFIMQGFLILKTDFPKDFHDKLTEQMIQIYSEEGNPGNNLLPRIRELQKVFEHPVITGALTSVLGPDYMLHAHRHGHYNAVSTPGGWHKDSYWGYQRMRNHHPWWAMIMYFPQDTPVELGPTGIMPGTQNYETRIFSEDNNREESLASGEAGTFALIHYDIWHRSTPNVLGKPRYMLKFEFMRTAAPQAPSWDHREGEGFMPAETETSNRHEVLPLENDAMHRHEIMWEETWNWLCGQVGSMAGKLPEDPEKIKALELQLEVAHEPNAINAAYELACRGKQGIEALLQALHHKDVPISRLAAYGLSAAGPDAVAGLIEATEAARAETVSHAAFALGELRPYAAGAIPRVAALMEHPSEKVRRTAAEALGMIDASSLDAVNGLIQGLQDEDVQVRFTAGLSLTRMGSRAEAAVPYLAEALDDENRYVRAHAAEALRYIGTEKAKDILIKELFNSRWCTSTTPASTFYP